MTFNQSGAPVDKTRVYVLVAVRPLISLPKADFLCATPGSNITSEKVFKMSTALLTRDDCDAGRRCFGRVNTSVLKVLIRDD